MRISATAPRGASPNGETCGHRCPLCPGRTPCQRPRGHDREYGHRDSTGTDVRHVWRDDGRR
jgi:hypothetical protein